MIYKLAKVLHTSLLLPTTIALGATGLGVSLCLALFNACGTGQMAHTAPSTPPSSSSSHSELASQDGPAQSDHEKPAPPGNATSPESVSQDASLTSVGPGFPESGPWVSFYGPASKMRDLAKVASTYRIINIDADPDEGEGNFTDSQISALRAGGKNRVLSYLNIGSCERSRSYWSNAPTPFVPCGKNKAAQLGAYAGYRDETWMDPSNSAYQALVVDYVATRLAARKIDGFYLDNLEIIEHSPGERNGPCSAKCKQGGLDLVKRLRDKFPNLLLVMQNATGRTTRLGMTGGVRFATLLDGIAHEEVFKPRYDATAEAELLAWKNMNIKNKDGRPFWIATEDYVGSCGNERAARESWTRSSRHGFSPYISDESGGQNVVCYWRF